MITASIDYICKHLQLRYLHIVHFINKIMCITDRIYIFYHQLLYHFKSSFETVFNSYFIFNNAVPELAKPIPALITK